jgi:gas vesicle protein
MTKGTMHGLHNALVSAGFMRSRGPGAFVSFLVGTGVGLAAGAAVAILLTPTTGPEVRRELGSRARRIAERTQGAISEAKETVRNRIGGMTQDDYLGQNEIPVS